jgi:hypothetical protein
MEAKKSPVFIFLPPSFCLSFFFWQAVPVQALRLVAAWRAGLHALFCGCFFAFNPAVCSAESPEIH